IGAGVAVIFHNPLLGAVMGAAMVINNLVAGIAGVMVPITLDRLRIDPAVSSAVFVTTCTDCLGFLSFLGLATLVGLGREPNTRKVKPSLHLAVKKTSFLEKSIFTVPNC